MVVQEETSRPTLTLTEEEALALLIMCMLSPAKMDETAERALEKLAGFCKATQYYIVESQGE
jgi:endonuclease III